MVSTSRWMRRDTCYIPFVPKVLINPKASDVETGNAFVQTVELRENGVLLGGRSGQHRTIFHRV